MPIVENLAVQAVQVLHASREVRFGCLDQQMEVVGHVAPRAARPAVPGHRSVDAPELKPMVVRVEEGGLPPVAARRDVVDAAGHLDA
jgi:hypothetical protein